MAQLRSAVVSALDALCGHAVTPSPFCLADYMQLATLDSCAEYLTPKFNALAAKG